MNIQHTYDEAVALGLKYYTDIDNPCSYGHHTRYVIGNGCVECVKRNSKAQHARKTGQEEPPKQTPVPTKTKKKSRSVDYRLIVVALPASANMFEEISWIAKNCPQTMLECSTKYDSLGKPQKYLLRGFSEEDLETVLARGVVSRTDYVWRQDKTEKTQRRIKKSTRGKKRST